MADNESSSEAPPPRGPLHRPPRDPITIQGDASSGPKSEAATPPEPPAPARPVNPLAWGGAGGLVGALIALGAVALIPRGPDTDTLADRIAAVEKSQASADAARKTLATEVASNKAALDAPKPNPAADLTPKLDALNAGLSAAADERKALADRLDKLEQAAPNAKADTDRLDKLDKQAADFDARLTSAAEEEARLTKRQDAAAKPDAELEKRVAALEQNAGAAKDTSDKALEAAQAALAAANKAVDATQAERSDPRLADLAAKQTTQTEALAKLQADAGKAGERLDKLDATVFAPKIETRVPPAETAEAADKQAKVSARAIATLALRQRLQSGAPFAPELAALERAGAEPERIAALKPFADTGAPTPAALERSFAATRPDIVAATKPPPQSGALNQLFGEVQGLVKVRKVGESAGAAPDDIASRIDAALARGDVAAALASFGELPPAGQTAGKAWAGQARARLSAEDAANALSARAMADLGAPRS